MSALITIQFAVPVGYLPGDYAMLHGNSGSGNIDYDVKKIDMRAIHIAFEISKKLHFQSMAYDFLLNEQRNFEIAEISYTYVDRAVYDCSGFWDANLNWHEGHFWPQYLQLVDALKLPELKQPELK